MNNEHVHLSNKESEDSFIQLSKAMHDISLALYQADHGQFDEACEALETASVHLAAMLKVFDAKSKAPVSG